MVSSELETAIKEFDGILTLKLWVLNQVCKRDRTQSVVRWYTASGEQNQQAMQMLIDFLRWAIYESKLDRYSRYSKSLKKYALRRACEEIPDIYDLCESNWFSNMYCFFYSEIIEALFDARTRLYSKDSEIYAILHGVYADSETYL